MTSEQIIKTIKKHLEKAEKELEKCGKGSNYGKVAALKDVLLEVLTSEK